MSFCTPSCGYVSIAEKSILRSMCQAWALGSGQWSPLLCLYTYLLCFLCAFQCTGELLPFLTVPVISLYLCDFSGPPLKPVLLS